MLSRTQFIYRVSTHIFNIIIIVTYKITEILYVIIVTYKMTGLKCIYIAYSESTSLSISHLSRDLNVQI